MASADEPIEITEELSAAEENQIINEVSYHTPGLDS